MSISPAFLISSTLFVIMFTLGVSLRSTDLIKWVKHPALLLRIWFGSCFLVPLLALLLLQSPLAETVSPSARFAIALMALCPSAPLILRKAAKSGGDRQLAAVLQMFAAITTVASVPLLAGVFRAVFTIEGWQIIPVDVAVQVATAQLLPLFLGFSVQHFKPVMARQIEPSLEKISNILLGLVVLLVLAKAAPKLLIFTTSNAMALLLMILLVVSSLLIGYGLASRHSSIRFTAALVTAMRNPGLALLLVGTYGPQLNDASVGIFAYILTTIFTSSLFLKLAKSLDQH